MAILKATLSNDNENNANTKNKREILKHHPLSDTPFPLFEYN
jgi:hypothetical protein